MSHDANSLNASIQLVLPLVGVILGSLLTGIGALISSRKNRKRAIGAALADLLEIRHRMVAFGSIIHNIKSISGIGPDQMPALRGHMDRIIPIDTGLDERYSAALTLLAGMDPILAFKLRSKNDIPKVISNLRSMALASGSDLASFEDYETKLRAAVLPSLNSSVLSLAGEYSIFTKYKIHKLIKDSGKFSSEAQQFLDEMLSKMNKQPNSPANKA